MSALHSTLKSVFLSFSLLLIGTLPNITMLKYIIATLMLIAPSFAFKTSQLQQTYQWKELDFQFPTAKERTYAIDNGLFVEGNAAPIDVDIYYGANNVCKTFVTIPRFTTGIPATLATVAKTRNGPVLVPYPNYSWHSSHGMDCDGLTSVFRVYVDECHRLWVLDTGRIDTIQYCPPQLVVFDLRNDQLLHRYRFPQSQYKTGVSLFITPLVDVRDPPPHGRCQDTNVYIADVTGYGLLVYNFANDTSWRIENKLFHANPDYGTFTIAGETFDLMDGIFALSVTPRNSNYRNQRRYLYFHALASGTENYVPLDIIDNKSNFEEDVGANPRSFRVLGNRGIQAISQAIDSKGNVFFGLAEPIAIAKWNINTPYRRENIMLASRNTETLQFASGVKIRRNRQNQEELWVLTSRFQKIMTGSKNSSEVNFRIQGCLVDDLLNNRPCSPIKLHEDEPGSISTRGGANSDNLIFV